METSLQLCLDEKLLSRLVECSSKRGISVEELVEYLLVRFFKELDKSETPKDLQVNRSWLP